MKKVVTIEAMVPPSKLQLQLKERELNERQKKLL